MSAETESPPGEVRLDPESIEAIARRLAELLAGAAPQRPRSKLISADEVSELWGVSRRWVYDHAERLGVRRLGVGRRPRLRFDPDEVAERLGDPIGEAGGRSDARGSAAMRGDCRPNSLSTRTRAMVGRQAKRRPGRRCTAPRPGAEGGPSAR